MQALEPITHCYHPATADVPHPATSAPLDGPLERSSAPPWLTALLTLAIAYVGSQVITGVVVGVLLLLGSPEGDLGVMMSSVTEHAGTFLAANSAGQFLGLALPVIIIARLHSSRPWAFLRMRSFDSFEVGMAVLLWATTFPVISWAGSQMEKLPIPQSEFLRQMEEMSMQLIEAALGSGMGLPFVLFALAVTPAICEEILYRGYVQKQLERVATPAVAIGLTGLLFGLSHLRLTQLVPLTILGALMGYVAWRSRSLWPAVFFHLANNGFAVLYSRYASARQVAEPGALEEVTMPGYIAAAGLLATVLVFTLYRRHDQDPTGSTAISSTND